MYLRNVTRAVPMERPGNRGRRPDESHHPSVDTVHEPRSSLELAFVGRVFRPGGPHLKMRPTLTQVNSGLKDPAYVSLKWAPK